MKMFNQYYAKNLHFERMLFAYLDII